MKMKIGSKIIGTVVQNKFGDSIKGQIGSGGAGVVGGGGLLGGMLKKNDKTPTEEEPNINMELGVGYESDQPVIVHENPPT